MDRLLTTILDKAPPFRAAILQSGQATVSAFQRDGGPASWTALASALNCTSSSTDVEFTCVQSADAHSIRSILNSTGLEFRPVNDNITQRATPFMKARRAGSVAKVPMLVGSNGQEGMNLGPQYGITNFSSVTLADLQMVLYALTGSAMVVEQVGPLISLIQRTYPWFNLFEAGALLYTEVAYQCVSPSLQAMEADAGLT